MTAVEFEWWVIYHKDLYASAPPGKAGVDWDKIPYSIQRRIFKAAGGLWGSRYGGY